MNHKTCLWVIFVILSPACFTIIHAQGLGVQVVKGFYEALSEGDGQRASVFINPSKRRSKNYNPKALSDYYGRMAEPLRLLSVEELTPSEYLASYYFRGHGITCNGLSIVYLGETSEGMFIDKIKAQDGC